MCVVATTRSNEQQNISAMIETENLGHLYDPTFADDLALIDCRNWDAPREYTHRQIQDAAGACAYAYLARRGFRERVLEHLQLVGPRVDDGFHG